MLYYVILYFHRAMDREYIIRMESTRYYFTPNDKTPISSLSQLRTICDSSGKVLLLYHKINGKYYFIQIINGNLVGSALSVFINNYELTNKRAPDASKETVELKLVYNSIVNRDSCCYAFHRTMSNGTNECYSFSSIDEILSAIKTEPSTLDGIVMKSCYAVKHVIQLGALVSRVSNHIQLCPLV